MLTCKDVCDNATNHIEGPTTFSERMSLRFHLLMCKNCRRFYKQFQIALGVPAKMDGIESPTDEEIDKLVAALQKQTAD